MAANLPATTKAVYLPDRPTMCMTDYDAKLERIADRYLDYDIRMVTGTTCWFSLLFDKLLAAARRRGRTAESVSDLWPNLNIFFGGGVPARRIDTPVRTIDLAPTLASCLGIEPPDGLDGEIRFPCSK